MHLSEDIIQFVWKYGLFAQDDLKTTDGAEIQLLNRGIFNKNSGPDFTEAKIKLDQTIWAGQVEIHVQSSDWYRHHHEKDSAYNNVVLHVVYNNDKDVFINNQKLPVLELNGRIPPALFKKYKDLITRESEIPCKSSLSGVKEIILLSQLEKVLAERLIKKSELVLEIYKKCGSDWEETAFRWLSMKLIGKLNEQPMEWLLDKLNHKIFKSFGNDRFKKEAILLGTAGFLRNLEDDYTCQLKREFEFQKKKFNLAEMDFFVWKHGQIRPLQFPAFKLAQFAAILSENNFLFDSMKSMILKSPDSEMFQVSASEYWENHHSPGKQVKKRSVIIGEVQKNLLLINAVVPLIFAYGQFTQDEYIKERVIDFLTKIPAERNHISKKWVQTGIKISSAFDSQAYLELYNNSCIRKKCLSCNIGTAILKS